MVTKSRSERLFGELCVFGGNRALSHNVVLVLCILATLFVSEGH